METALAIDKADQRAGQPVRQLRQSVRNGVIRCERAGRGWLIPEAERAG